MPTWALAGVAIGIVGAAIIVWGYFHDRNRNRGRLTAPPRRSIPGFAEDQPPAYLSRAAALAPPAAPAQPIDFAALTKDATALSVGMFDAAFATHRPYAVAHRPLIMICGERISTIRELLPILEYGKSRDTPLVIIAADFSDVVAETLLVNVRRALLRVIPIAAPDVAQVFQLAKETGSTILAREDLQAGDLQSAHLGSCKTWIANTRKSWIVL